MDNTIKIILVILVAFLLLNYSCSNSQKELFAKKRNKKKKSRKRKSKNKSKFLPCLKVIHKALNKNIFCGLMNNIQLHEEVAKKCGFFGEPKNDEDLNKFQKMQNWLDKTCEIGP